MQLQYKFELFSTGNKAVINNLRKFLFLVTAAVLNDGHGGQTQF
jgi:hypothetical protein